MVFDEYAIFGIIPNNGYFFMCVCVCILAPLSLLTLVTEMWFDIRACLFTAFAMMGISCRVSVEYTLCTFICMYCIPQQCVLMPCGHRLCCSICHCFFK